MSAGLEREIKLRFDTPEEARRRILGLGAVPRTSRRLQRDTILDLPDGRLAMAGCALRVRADGARAALTFKGPVQPGVLKVREEIETAAESADALLAVFERLTFTPAFIYEKYREEFSLDGAVVAIDETPIGTYVEVEGEEAAVHTIARGLERAPSEYITSSYRTLFVAANGRGNMTFPVPPA